MSETTDDPSLPQPATTPTPSSPLKTRDYATSLANPIRTTSSPLPIPQMAASPTLANPSAPPTPRGGPPRPLGGPAGGIGPRPGPGIGQRGGLVLGGSKMPPSLAAKLAANAAKSSSGASSPSLGPAASTSTHLEPGQRLDASSFSLRPSGALSSNPSSRPGSSSLANRRPKPSMKLGDMHGGAGPGAFTDSNWTGGQRSTAGGGGGGGLGRGGVGMTLSNMGNLSLSDSSSNESSPGGLGFGLGRGSAAPFENFRKIVDPSGRLQFGGKAVIHDRGVDFSNGSSFAINMTQLDLVEELGKGNYGTVQKVLHKPTKVLMAMKEIRLELDDSKLKAIITELDILHRATAPEIVDFYGAFFIESCVYYCMEYMDAGSLEQLASPGLDVPEDVLARVTASMVRGLRFLKDELQTMHRDVKPTNVVVNRAGLIKLCDFGVSGQLERSLAKTNIGCQSYMAPERIKGESVGAVSTYTVSSDVWSLGLSIIEFAVGHYPYPPETYSNVFAQLQAIVHGDPPELPDKYSEEAKDFVRRCLEKNPDRRPTYKQLLEHPFLKKDEGRDVDMVGWIEKALAARDARREEEARARATRSGSLSAATGVGIPIPAVAAESAPPPQVDGKEAEDKDKEKERPTPPTVVVS